MIHLQEESSYYQNVEAVLPAARALIARLTAGSEEN